MSKCYNCFSLFKFALSSQSIIKIIAFFPGQEHLANIFNNWNFASWDQAASNSSDNASSDPLINACGDAEEEDCGSENGIYLLYLFIFGIYILCAEILIIINN